MLKWIPLTSLNNHSDEKSDCQNKSMINKIQEGFADVVNHYILLCFSK